MVARRAARGRAATGASHARLMPFQRSMIYMGSIAGMTMSDIAGKVQKSDGSFPSVNVALPTKPEPRPVFLRRLHRAVAWVNANRAEYLWYLCHAQKEWAQDVWEAKPPGARTKH